MAAKQNVKRRIVDAAWELFYEKGYDDTTVDDIIRLSETSKGSFYYYFSSKDSLLDTLSTILDENYAKLEDELDPEMNSFDKLMYLNYRSHSFMEQKIDVALLSSLYSTQLIAKGDRNLLEPYLLQADQQDHRRGACAKSDQQREEYPGDYQVLFTL